MGGCCCCPSTRSETNVPSTYYYSVLFRVLSISIEKGARGGCSLWDFSHKWSFHLIDKKYPRTSDERQPLSAPQGAAPTGLLVDTNLETSIPDTYRPPPAPIPYDAGSGNTQSQSGNVSNSSTKSDGAAAERNPDSVVGSAGSLGSQEKDLKVKNEKVGPDLELNSSNDCDDDLKKSVEPIVTTMEEEDVCPICLEEYTEENPKILTKCDHHFHLSCILEWMERSDSCPVCDKEVMIDDVLNG